MQQLSGRWKCPEQERNVIPKQFFSVTLNI